MHTKDIHTGKKQKTSIWYEHFGLNKELQPNPNYTASEQENYKKGYLKKIKFDVNISGLNASSLSITTKPLWSEIKKKYL